LSYTRNRAAERMTVLGASAPTGQSRCVPPLLHDLSRQFKSAARPPVMRRRINADAILSV